MNDNISPKACVTTCSLGYYTNVNLRKCQACTVINCEVCSSTNKDTCDSCKTTGAKYIKENSCVTEC